MSPEQCRGLPADNRSDIYSLGVMLYEMCTGDLPFKADSLVGFITAHNEESPPSPRQINPQLSTTVEDIILRALAKSPEARFQVASELADEFSTAVGASETNIKPASEVETPLEQNEFHLPQKACFRSVSSGTVYPLDALIDNRVGRSKNTSTVEVDISSEQGGDYVHSVHAILRFGDSGWELIPLSTNKNPTFVNDSKINPGESVILSTGDRVAFSGTKFVFEFTR
jgi:serine/threonine protein kinase